MEGGGEAFDGRRFIRRAGGLLAAVIAIGCSANMDAVEQQAERLNAGDIAAELSNCGGGTIIGTSCTSLVDNPSLTSLYALDNVDTNWGGPHILRAQEQVVSGAGFVNYNGDFKFVAFNGDGNANGLGLSQWPTVAAVNGSLFGWNEGGTTDVVAPNQIQPIGRGVRLGYRPLLVEADVTQPNSSVVTKASPVDLHLDASVSLVPIQVAVMFSPGWPKVAAGWPQNPTGYTVQNWRLPAQVAFWDQVQTAEKTANFAGNGELISVQRVFAGLTSFKVSTWLDPFNRNGASVYAVRRQLTPDSVWGPACHVQFRLVNYLEVPTDDRHVLPIRDGMPGNWPTNANDDQPCIDNSTLVASTPGFISGIPTVIFMAKGVFPGTGEQAITVYSPKAACVNLDVINTASLADIAHELGHVLSGNINHADPNCRTMCSQGSDGPALANECGYVANARDLAARWPH